MNSKITGLLLAVSVMFNAIQFKSISNFFKSFKKEKVFSFAPKSHGSAHISKQDAINLTHDYNVEGRYLLTKDPDDTNQTVPLLGLIFNADHIREIVDTNKSGEIPDKVALFFGFNTTENEYHIIALGIKNDTLLDFKPGVTGAAALTTNDISVFDKADPCPKCTHY